MGDVGALALGGALGTIAVIVRQEIVLFIMGGVFVVETLSVMLQVAWFKYTKKRYGEGRRIFRMAPLHHHFEVSGWKDTQVVEIGRESWRERVCKYVSVSVVAVSVKKNHNKMNKK